MMLSGCKVAFFFRIYQRYVAHQGGERRRRRWRLCVTPTPSVFPPCLPGAPAAWVCVTQSAPPASRLVSLCQVKPMRSAVGSPVQDAQSRRALRGNMSVGEGPLSHQRSLLMRPGTNLSGEEVGPGRRLRLSDNLPLFPQ